MCTSVFIYNFMIFWGKNLKIIAFKYLYEEFEELGRDMNKGMLGPRRPKPKLLGTILIAGFEHSLSSGADVLLSGVCIGKPKREGKTVCLKVME